MGFGRKITVAFKFFKKNISFYEYFTFLEHKVLNFKLENKYNSVN